MQSEYLFLIFLIVRLFQHLLETYLSNLNYVFYNDTKNLQLAKQTLGISDADLEKSVTYANERLRFGRFTQTLTLSAFFIFLAVGGLGALETSAKWVASEIGFESSIWVGLFFFAQMGLISTIWSLPFSWHQTFVIEEKFGFNKTTKQIFFADFWKSLAMGALLGGALLAVLLWVMGSLGSTWWLVAWVAMMVFSLLISWIYPTFLAPLFNKFSPLPEGELKEKIQRLAEQVGFRMNGLFLMNASLRSAHGNAYFTGVFGKKRIVLFDTLVDAMDPDEVTAVLAHELGHFKLHHVRWGLLRGFAMTGVMFYLLSLCLPMEEFYLAFQLEGVSHFGALLVFSLWYGPIGFLLQPISTYLSRKNEFAADEFARKNMGKHADKLATALLKLREKSSALPTYHPLYSMIYHSHPPMLERLQAMGYRPQ